MSIMFKKGRSKPYYFSFSTGQQQPDGSYKRIYSNTGYATRKEAEAAELEARHAVQTNTYIEPLKITVLEMEMLEKFLDTKIEIRPATRTQYRNSIEHAREHPIAIRQLQKATVFDVEDYRKYLYQKVADKKLSLQTIREDLSFLRSAFAWAADNDLIVKSPARLLKLPPKQPPKGIHTPLENLLDILSIIRREAYDSLYIPLLLAGFVGLRVSEICGLQLKNITERSITVTNNIKKENGSYMLTPLKTKTSCRTIPLLRFVRKEIDQYIKHLTLCHKNAMRKRWELLSNENYSIDMEHLEPVWKNDLQLLYIFPDDGRPHTKDYVEKKWLKLKKYNKSMLRFLDAHPELREMRIHDWRHSCGSNMRDQGIPIEDIAEMLGHSDAEFTRHTYALPLEDTHRKAINEYEKKIACKFVNFL